MVTQQPMLKDAPSHLTQHADQYFAQEGWQGPGNLKASLARHFHDYVNPDTCKLHCGASDYIRLSAIVATWAEQNLVGTTELDSFTSACVVLRCLLALKACPAAERLAALRLHLRRHGEARDRAYGSESKTPKSHYNLHIQQQVEADGLVVDCFLLERHHRSIKAVATNIKDLRTYSASLLKSMTLVHLNSLCEEGELFKGLRQAVDIPEMPGIRASRKVIDHNGCSFHVGDFIFYDGQAACIDACVSDGVDFGVHVTLWDALAEAICSGLYTRTDRSACWDTRPILRATVWRVWGDGTVTICR